MKPKLDPFSISNKIIECLRPDLDEQIEKKQLDEHDAIRKGEVTIIPCRHWPTITHTNGDIECLVCHEMLKETKPNWKKEE